jgi:UDPglucose--hexose-1-phosphate uridylyltransferase
MTPPEIARTGEGEPGTPGWRVRVFPNLYPFAGGPDAGSGATGAHEVVVLSPDHDRAFADLGDDEAFDVVAMLRERARALGDGGHAYVQLLVNQGRAAGASIAHPHAQVVALDFVPPVVEILLARYADADGDLVAGDADDASERGYHVLEAADSVRVWSPWGAATPFEVRVAPVRSVARITDAGDDELRAVAVAVRDVLRRVRSTLGDPPYNMVWHTAPSTGNAPYHWWIEVVPRISTTAGFEIGTGVFVNTVAPEDAAAQLREATSI